MDSISEKFAKLGCDNAPGQETLQKETPLDLRGPRLSGAPVDFSHGDVDAFEPLPGSLEVFTSGFYKGGKQAYTEYRGKNSIRREVAEKLAAFTGASIDPDTNLILTPGTQGALFLAMGALVAKGDRVAIVEPDYFANRKLVEFFDGSLVPIPMNYYESPEKSGIDLASLEAAFKSGVKLFLFSNPNNPTGAVYSYDEICSIAALAKKYDAALLVDELYSRQIFDGRSYTHLCARREIPQNLVTVMGPSKTESLSGFRLGAAFGTAHIITRMEKLQAIVSLRPPDTARQFIKPGFPNRKALWRTALQNTRLSGMRSQKDCQLRRGSESASPMQEVICFRSCQTWMWRSKNLQK